MRFYSMFCGIGGFDLGLERAGHACVGACEIEPAARGIYARHWPDVPLGGDARSVDPGRLPEFELLAAGFPCQPFSCAGRRRGLEDARGSLFAEALRVAAARRADILLENVPALLSNDGGRTFEVILRALDECGYHVGWQCIDGRFFLPQGRKRLFLLGSLDGRSPRLVLPIFEDDRDGGGPRRQAESKGERVRPPDVLGTIAASYARGQTPLIDESGGRLRMLTPLEVERLQGFPDGWTELDAGGREVPRTNRYRALGNSVMVPVAEYLGRLIAA